MHVPYITSTMGRIPNSESLTEHQIDCTITDYNPISDLNLLAIDNLTISGTRLPYELAKSEVTLTFTDEAATSCVPQVSSSEELVCLTQPFSLDAAGSSIGMTIEINGLVVENDLTFTLMTEARSGVLFTPDSASPVLKSNVTITLEADFPFALNKADFSVNATAVSLLDTTKEGIEVGSYFRQMNVIDVVDTEETLDDGTVDVTKQVVVKFGGAWSGDYSIDIRHRSADGGASYGLIDTSGLVFKVGAWVDSITPQEGSRFGGTLVTITGQNFGSEKTDNPVQISTLGGVGSIDCYVQTTSTTEITCRVDETDKGMNEPAKMIAFLKTSEEAPCGDDTDNCAWTYKEPDAILTSRTLAFNPADLRWELTVVGVGFSGTPELWVGSKQ